MRVGADRVLWLVCLALGAAAVLGERALQAEWWAVAERDFIDPEDGSWQHELDPSNRPASSVWDGKPDVYHALQATLIPRVPLRESLAASLRAAGPPSGAASSPPP